MECLHRLLWWGIEVIAMDLQEVNIRCLQALERRVNLVEDSRTRKARLVHVFLRVLYPGLSHDAYTWVTASNKEALGEDYDLLARDIVL